MTFLSGRRFCGNPALGANGHDQLFFRPAGTFEELTGRGPLGLDEELVFEEKKKAMQQRPDRLSARTASRDDRRTGPDVR
jgi:hypothetical protein